MKAFVVLILIAAGVGGYFFYKHRAGADTAVTEPTGIPGPGGTIPGPASGKPGTQTPVTPPAPVVPAAVKAEYDKAEALWKEASAAGDVATSRSAPELDRLYSKVLKGLYNQPGVRTLEEQLVQTRLAPLGTALFFSKSRCDDAVFAVHTVAPGDVPDKIAAKYGMSYQQLNRLRGHDVNDTALRPGDTLKVIRMKDSGGSLLHADKGDFHLDVFVGGLFAHRYDISIGAPESPTPVGTTKVVDLVFNPRWKNPKTGETYESGDPRNILGGVWLALDAEGIHEQGIGLHGYTGEDQTLRRQVSNGCIRLGNEAIKELAYLIAHPNRSPTAVEIVE